MDILLLVLLLIQHTFYAYVLNHQLVSVQFISVPWLIGFARQFSRDPLLALLKEALVSSSAMGSSAMGVAHPQGALKNGSGEAVVACDMPEPCKFLSLDSCQKRFLWAHKEVDVALHPVVDLVLPVGGAEKFPRCTYQTIIIRSRKRLCRSWVNCIFHSLNGQFILLIN